MKRVERMDKECTQKLYGFIKQHLEHSEGFMEYLPVTVKDIYYLNSVDGEAELKVQTTEIKNRKIILTYDVAFVDSYENIICKATLEYFALNEIKLEEMNI